MIYKHLDGWDVQHIKDNVTDINSLLHLIDRYCDVAFDKGHNDGYIDGYIQCRLDDEEDNNEDE